MRFMKRIAYLLLGLSILGSCEKENYLLYDTTQQDGVYLDYTADTDSVFYNFGFESKTQDVIELNVNLMGVPKDYDRTFNVTTCNDRYAGNGFKAAKDKYFSVPSSVVLPAGAVTTVIPVTLIRDAELSYSENRSILTIELADSDDLAVRGQKEYTITFDDILPSRPAWWGTYKYGAFTKVKAQKFYELFWATESTQSYFYDKIVERWGREMTKTPNSGQNSPLTVYSMFFKKYVDIPWYNYFVEHPELLDGEVLNGNYFK